MLASPDSMVLPLSLSAQLPFGNLLVKFRASALLGAVLDVEPFSLSPRLLHFCDGCFPSRLRL